MSNEFNIRDMILGDYAGDGTVTISDAQGTLDDAANIIAGNPTVLSMENLPRVDIDCNGDLQARDAQYILQYVTDKTIAQKTGTHFDDIIATGKAPVLYAGYYVHEDEEFYMVRYRTPYDDETYYYDGPIPKSTTAKYYDITPGVEVFWYKYEDEHFIPITE